MKCSESRNLVRSRLALDFRPLRLIVVFVSKKLAGPLKNGATVQNKRAPRCWNIEYTVKLEPTNTCQQWPLLWSPHLCLYNINLPLNNDHLSTTVTNFGSWGWSLYTGLTVVKFYVLFSKIQTVQKSFLSRLFLPPWRWILWLGRFRLDWWVAGRPHRNESRWGSSYGPRPGFDHRRR